MLIIYVLQSFTPLGMAMALGRTGLVYRAINTHYDVTVALNIDI